MISQPQRNRNCPIRQSLMNHAAARCTFVRKTFLYYCQFRLGIPLWPLDKIRPVVLGCRHRVDGEASADAIVSRKRGNSVTAVVRYGLETATSHRVATMAKRGPSIRVSSAAENGNTPSSPSAEPAKGDPARPAWQACEIGRRAAAAPHRSHVKTRAAARRRPQACARGPSTSRRSSLIRGFSRRAHTGRPEDTSKPRRAEGS